MQGTVETHSRRSFLLVLEEGDSIRIPPLTSHQWKNQSGNTVLVIFKHYASELFKILKNKV